MNSENIEIILLKYYEYHWLSMFYIVLCFTSLNSIEFIFTKWASQGSLPVRFSESRPWADRVRLYSLLHFGRACEGCGRLCLFKLCHSTAESRKSLKTILVTRNTSVAGDPWGFWRAGNDILATWYWPTLLRSPSRARPSKVKIKNGVLFHAAPWDFDLAFNFACMPRYFTNALTGEAETGVRLGTKERIQVTV